MNNYYQLAILDLGDFQQNLGFGFGWLNKTMWITLDTLDPLLTLSKKWLYGSLRMNAGIPLAEFEFVLAKLWHAFITFPEEK